MDVEPPPLYDFVPAVSGSLPVLSPDGHRLAWLEGGSVQLEPPESDALTAIVGWMPVMWASQDVLVVNHFPGWGVLDTRSGSLEPLEHAIAVERAGATGIAVLGATSTEEARWLNERGIAVSSLVQAGATSILVDRQPEGSFRRFSRDPWLRSDGSLTYRTRVWAASGRRVLSRPPHSPWAGDFRVFPKMWHGAILALDGQHFEQTTLALLNVSSGLVEGLVPTPARGATASVLRDPISGEPLAVGIRAERLEWQAISAAVGADLDAINKALPEDDWVPGGVSDDLGTWLLYSDGPESGRQAWLYEREARSLRPLGTVGRVLARPGRPTSVRLLPGTEGTVVGAYLTTPDTAVAGPGPWPLVVLAHGGPHTQRYYWGYHFATQRLAALGAAVLAINYQGSDGYGTKFAYSAPGSDVENLITAVRGEVESGIADPERVAVVGASYGGILALRLARDFPGLLRCGVAVSANLDWPRSNVSAPPMLLIGGGRDEKVPLALTRRTARALERIGATGPAVTQTGGHTFVVFPDEGHIVGGAQPAAWSVTERFLGACLGTAHSALDGMLDGHRIEAPLANLPGLAEALDKARREGKQALPFEAFGVGRPIPDPLWIPQ